MRKREKEGMVTEGGREGQKEGGKRKGEIKVNVAKC